MDKKLTFWVWFDAWALQAPAWLLVAIIVVYAVFGANA
jgi:hypothetical protein